MWHRRTIGEFDWLDATTFSCFSRRVMSRSAAFTAVLTTVLATVLVAAASGCYVRPTTPDATVRPVTRVTHIYGDSTLIEVKDELRRLRPGIDIVSIAGTSPCNHLPAMLAAVKHGERVVLAFTGVGALGQTGSCMFGRDADSQIGRSYVADIAKVVAAAHDPYGQVVIALSPTWRDAMTRSLNVRNELIHAADVWRIRIVDAAEWVTPNGVYSDTAPAWPGESPQANGIVRLRGPDGGHQCLTQSPNRTLTGPSCDASTSPGVQRYALGLAQAVSV